MKRRVMFTARVLLIFSTTWTAPAWSQTKVYDSGRMSCGYWIEARAGRENPTDVRFIQAQEWISGFLTAYNYYVHPGVDVAEGTDRAGMYAWIDNYCRGNPNDIILTGVVALINHLRAR